MKNIILEELFELLKDCEYYDNGCLCKYSNRDDESREIDSFIENFFIEKGIIVKTDITEAFESSEYDCSVLSVAWILDKKLYLETFLLESY